MKENYKYSFAVIVGAVVVAASIWFFGGRTAESLSAPNGQFAYDTTSKGFTESTTTINTTSTNLWASTSKVNYVFYSGTSTITCSADANNTTAASSTVTAGRGLIFGNSSGSGIARIGFGQCYAGNTDCYLHTGAVNCVANVATQVSVVKQ